MGICVKLYRYEVKPTYSCPLFDPREKESDQKQCQYCKSYDTETVLAKGKMKR